VPPQLVPEPEAEVRYPHDFLKTPRGFNCFVFVSNELVSTPDQLHLSSPGAARSLPIPNDPSLAGLKLYAQWWISYSTGGPSCPIYMSGWVTSNAVELTLGY
jgi:hypothetical protein